MMTSALAGVGVLTMVYYMFNIFHRWIVLPKSGLRNSLRISLQKPRTIGECDAHPLFFINKDRQIVERMLELIYFYLYFGVYLLEERYILKCRTHS